MTPPKDYEVPKQFNWWKFFAIISWILLAIVLYLWLFIPNLEASEDSCIKCNCDSMYPDKCLCYDSCREIQLPIFTPAKASQPRVEKQYTDSQLANAIYKAEHSKTHPYGIMTHYKHTTPRQACLNTIAHARKDWDGKGDFIEFLQKRYAPIGAKNDPKGLNKFWLVNVKYFLGR